MTAAYRLKGLGWFASCTAIVLGCYLVSVRVASERGKLDAVQERIRMAERDVRALETEFDTRANLRQLERWNGDVLALSAPVAGQFVRHEAQLASVSFDTGAPLAPGGAEVRTAALVVPSMPAAAPAAVAPAAPVQLAAVVPVAAPRARVSVAAAVVKATARVASAVADKRSASKALASAKRPAATPKVMASAPEVIRPSPSIRPAPSIRPERVAMLDGDLLSDLSKRARDEAGRR